MNLTGRITLLPIRKLRSPSAAPAPDGMVLWLALGAAAILGAGLAASRPASEPEIRDSVRVLTYNIQQGYADDGARNPGQQLALMERTGADIIGLQETDTNRIAGGNADLIRYFADRLDMYSYYGPKVVAGTFGIALLSRYPIENPRTFYLYSEGEQTAAIQAEITVGDRRYNVFVTHLGNGGPVVQQEGLLQLTAGLDRVIAMGDFNFRPDTPQYALTRTQLEDAWLLKWPEGIDRVGNHPDRRIDHVFVSPGIQVLNAQYLTGPESDHPAVLMDLE